MSRLGLPKDAPSLPEGYYYGQSISTNTGTQFAVCFRGARIFIVAVDMDHQTGQTWCKARPVLERLPPTPLEWIEYPDLPTLVTSMITKHRLGVI